MRSKMKRVSCLSVFALAILFGVSGPAAAQSQGAGPTGGHPDFSGIWYAPTPDISVALLPGQEISLTAYGAERYRKVDMANSPSYKCLPYGPVRSLQASNPFQIIQTADVFAILTEHIDYRLIYTDGRGHPEDIDDY